MPNIHGELTLKEVAEQLGVSTSWINKVQVKTGIPRPIGSKGLKVTFTKLQIVVLERVNILRLLNFSFEEIKYLYKLEAELEEMQAKAALNDFLKDLVALRKKKGTDFALLGRKQTTRKELVKDVNKKDIIKHFMEIEYKIIRIHREIFRRLSLKMKDMKDFYEIVKTAKE